MQHAVPRVKPLVHACEDQAMEEDALSNKLVLDAAECVLPDAQ
jgi:hypothetical protein